MVLKHLLPYQLREAVGRGDPLLVPAGCVETHGPHMAIGHDTLIVEEICRRVAERTSAVIAPSFDYGPTGYALGGPVDGTIDPDYASFEPYVKGILRNFLAMGFRKTYVVIMHQGMDAPLALAFRKAAAELAFELPLQKGYPHGWWGMADWKQKNIEEHDGQIEVCPMILPESSPPADGDHAAHHETSFLLAARPELVDQSRLDDNAPWYCRKNGPKNSWNANAEHGQEMIDAVVNAWICKIDSARE